MNPPIQCEIQKGDAVRYTPSERTRGWEPHNQKYGYQIGAVYRVLEIDKEGYITVHPELTPSHRSNFKKELGYDGAVSIPEPWPQADTK